MQQQRATTSHEARFLRMLLSHHVTRRRTPGPHLRVVGHRQRKFERTLVVGGVLRVAGPHADNHGRDGGRLEHPARRDVRDRDRAAADDMPVADGAQRTQQRLQRVPAVAAEAAAAARDEAAVLGRGRGRGKPASRVRPLYPRRCGKRGDPYVTRRLFYLGEAPRARELGRAQVAAPEVAVAARRASPVPQ